MSNNRTVQQILSAAKVARNELGKLNGELQNEITALDAKVRKERRKHTNGEKAERTELRAAQMEISEAVKLLTFVTLQSLDESDEVKFLQKKMKEVNSIIDDDLERLGKLDRYTKIAANVVDAVAKVTERLVTLAANVG